jgi:alanine-glyoxylate transaminase/serine-glyoxylate transaminase/serine-pyruvate transaminase
MPSVDHELDPSPRLLLGPGPSLVAPRVLRALAAPMVGHLDPEFMVILADIQALLRMAFQTENRLTLALSGTGTSAMEAALANLVEPGEPVLACVQGFFGDRLAEIARRLGGDVQRLEVPWGQTFEVEAIERALRERSARVVTLVHAETSTGARQPEIAAIAEACHRQGGLLILDCVTSLGGLPVEIDAWQVDAAYSASQKCLSAPPGMAPITVSPRAEEKIRTRKSPIPTFYLDLTLLARYWSDAPAYHHTAPISLAYALREALRLVNEEGLAARFDRHRRNALRLWQGLEDLDLPLLVPEAVRLPSLSTPKLAPGIDDAAVRRRLLNDYNIEIAGGFGPLAGAIWRIGLMGHSSRPENVVTLLGALREILRRG